MRRVFSACAGKPETLTPNLTPIECAKQRKTALFARNIKNEKALQIVDLQGFQVVEVVGFEPTAFWSRT